MRKGLPTISGRGFLISKGIDLQFGKSGVAWARVPLVFKSSHYDKDADEWVDDNEILLQGTAFGSIAEYLADQIPAGGHADIDVVGEIYTDTWTKDGEEFSATKLNIAAASVVPAKGKSSGRKGSSKPAAAQQDPWANVPKDDPWGPPPGGDDEPPF